MDTSNGQQKPRITVSRQFRTFDSVAIALLIAASLGAIVALGAGQSFPMEPYLVEDINTATEASDPLCFIDVDGTLFFRADQSCPYRRRRCHTVKKMLIDLGQTS